VSYIHSCEDLREPKIVTCLFGPVCTSGRSPQFICLALSVWICGRSVYVTFVPPLALLDDQQSLIFISFLVYSETYISTYV
jgi:hypothetical protein